MRRIVTWVGVPFLVIAAGAAGTGWTLTRDDGGSAQASDSIGATGTITRGTVIQNETYDGAIGYAEARPVVNQRMGTLTRVPDTGVVIGRGEALYRVDDQPVVLLIGDLPLYRTLSEGVEGKDVRQLERNLKTLGYADAITVDDEFTDGTGDAVEEFRDDYGLSDGESIAVGDVVFQPTLVRVSGAAVDVGSPVRPGAVAGGRDVDREAGHGVAGFGRRHDRGCDGNRRAARREAYEGHRRVGRGVVVAVE